jgi:hypothetical protein
VELRDLSGENDLLGGGFAHEDVVDGVTVVVPDETEAGGAIGLRVAIDEKDLEAFESEACGEVNRSGGFANSALLVDNAENLSHGNQE